MILHNFLISPPIFFALSLPDSSCFAVTRFNIKCISRWHCPDAGEFHCSPPARVCTSNHVASTSFLWPIMCSSTSPSFISTPHASHSTFSSIANGVATLVLPLLALSLRFFRLPLLGLILSTLAQ